MDEDMAESEPPAKRSVSGRRLRRRCWLPWLVTLLALAALIAVLVIGKAAYTGDTCGIELNERLDEPVVDVPNRGNADCF